MNLHQTQLVAYGAASIIHGALIVLVLRLYRRTAGEDRIEAFKRVAVCAAGFLWQFGNFWEKANVVHATVGVVLWYNALISFPLLFTYSLHEPTSDSRVARFVTLLARALRYPLWIFTLTSAVSLFLALSGKRPLLDPDLAIQINMRVMLVFFLMFMTLSFIRRRRLRRSGDRTAHRANRVAIAASITITVMFVVMVFYPGAIKENASWIELASGMMTIPPTITTAYRLYRFPFMDAFLRETLTGVILLVAFSLGLSLGPQAYLWLPFWTATMAIAAALMKAPLARWVERRFLGYDESAEDQEERIGASVRAVTQLEDFDSRVTEILRAEVDADWARIGVEPATGAAHTFQVPDSPPLWLSLGPRKNGRAYMSRHLRLARTSVMEIAAQRQRLKREEIERRSLVEQHELREITARAQMRALQAQINPHFLFNTLNTLAALIETNPDKAERVTEDLADVFRYALDSTRVERVTLDEELKFLESYLAIEKARFETRLSYSFDVDPDARRFSIPPMLLQPLVENAVRHGIGQKLDGGSVRVIARLNADLLTIQVEDTGVGFVRERPGGIGLTNVRERLRHAYGDKAELRIEPLEPEGTRMILTLQRILQ